MHERGLAGIELLAELADRLEERQALDVAHRAADFAQHEIGVAMIGEDEFLDRVGDVRDHLHGGAEIIAAPLLGDDFLIDAAGGDVVGLRGRDAGEALIMAEVEIGFRAIVGDEHFPVLIGAHRARIDVQVGIELAKADLEAPSLQQRAKSCGGDALPKRRDHAPGNEHVARHAPFPFRFAANHSSPWAWLIGLGRRVRDEPPLPRCLPPPIRGRLARALSRMAQSPRQMSPAI